MKKDVEISREIGIPTTTLADWKRSDPKGWRFNLYHTLKESDVTYTTTVEDKLDKVLKPLDELMLLFIDDEVALGKLSEARTIIFMETLKA